MDTNTQKLYEAPIAQPVEIMTEGIICESELPYKRGDYFGSEI